MKFWVGTSGYTYWWNEGRDKLAWYISQGFNTVEINSTFYSFPFQSSVKAWGRAPEGFMFSVKVHRLITHYTKLSSREPWLRFRERLRPIDGRIRFWLFQMPPSFGYSEANLERIVRFIKEEGDGREVFEFRDPSWWGEGASEVVRAGGVFCSVSAPGLPDDVVNSNGYVYMRFHGRDEWYAYVYSDGELKEYYRRILGSGGREAWVYFNNDTGMFENALQFLRMASAGP